MRIREFAEEIRQRITGKIEDVIEIKIKPVLKNNNKKLTAFVFRERVQRVTPTIYLDEFYVEYEEKKIALDEIAEQIIRMYRKYRVLDDVDMDFVRNWERVKDKVVYRLVNKKQNPQLLKQVPHEEVLDLAKVFYISFNEECSMMVHHGFCREWGIGKKELIEAAEKNTPLLYPVQILVPENIIRKIFHLEENEPVYSSVGMYFITNKSSLHGAAAMLYPEVLSNLAENLKSDLYIFPSSIHEVGVILANEDNNPKMLLEVVREVNQTTVEKEEILGENIYLYKKENGELTMITE